MYERCHITRFETSAFDVPEVGGAHSTASCTTFADSVSVEKSVIGLSRTVNRNTLRFPSALNEKKKRHDSNLD